MTRLVLPRAAARPMLWLVHATARFARPMTMGVRAMILDDRDRVFLVRHSYVPGWHMPGGGVDAGETVGQAMVREVREEAGLAVEGEAPLHGLFFNRAMSNRDHVAVYVVRTHRPLEAPASDWEIVERGFHDIRALPEGTTGPTRARLAEVLDGVPRSEMW